ncbi:hypothetical protein Bbad01_24820 [Bacillus badius]|nr:hypothetical protein [Bacillus badius]GLY11266.1 hypothetical protein Bbad01_24820 [Bacillus badius]
MLLKHHLIQRDQIDRVALDQPVPGDHLARKMEAAIGFLFIYDSVEELYLEVGRPSIDPVILMNRTFIRLQ